MICNIYSPSQSTALSSVKKIAAYNRQLITSLRHPLKVLERGLGDVGSGRP